mgnify:CR=1 FL=1
MGSFRRRLRFPYFKVARLRPWLIKPSSSKLALLKLALHGRPLAVLLAKLWAKSGKARSRLHWRPLLQFWNFAISESRNFENVKKVEILNFKKFDFF